MTYYGGKELADAFRTVRNNTIKIAEEVPRTNARSRRRLTRARLARRWRTSASRPAFGYTREQSDQPGHGSVHGAVPKFTAEEAKPRTKAEIIAFLKSQGDTFASFLESLPESFLAEQVTMPPGAPQARRNRFEMLMSAKEHEMHHRGRLDDDAADQRAGAAHHPRGAGANGANDAAGGARTGMNFPAETQVSARAQAQQSSRVVQRPPRRLRVHVRQPMTAIVERLAVDLRAFAPELVASPKVSIYRIYRDTRFSDNKTPYKTHVAASFPTLRARQARRRRRVFSHLTRRSLDRRRHARRSRRVFAVRQHIAGHLKQLRTIVESPGFRKQFGALEGEPLTRVPRGFSKDDPAAEYSSSDGSSRAPNFRQPLRFHPRSTRRCSPCSARSCR
jgi:uncharacterized protein (TIGR02453 family)